MRGADMNKPTGWKCDIMLCLLPVIESGRPSLQVVALAADTIAACARFNIWAQECENRRGAQAPKVERWLQLMDFYDALIAESQAAVQKLERGGDRGEFADALRRVTEKLNQRPDLTRPISEESK